MRHCFAARRRAAPGVPTEFHVADVLAYTRGAPDCDLILASFSLHHLDSAAKGDLLKAAYQRLVRGRWVLCCDGGVVASRGLERGAWRCLPGLYQHSVRCPAVRVAMKKSWPCCFASQLGRTLNIWFMFCNRHGFQGRVAYLLRKALMAGFWVQAKRKGFMLLVDILAREGEPLDAYHVRATADVDDNWVCFDPASRVTLKHHISTVRWARALRGCGVSQSCWEDTC